VCPVSGEHANPALRRTIDRVLIFRQTVRETGDFMSLQKDQIVFLAQKFGKNNKDTGAVEVQIALLTERIKTLTEHCKQFKKDCSGRRGLLILVGKRRRILKYMQRINLEGYRALIKELGLRK
jgi:small subunit ribosomal protein S15